MNYPRIIVIVEGFMKNYTLLRDSGVLLVLFLILTLLLLLYLLLKPLHLQIKITNFFINWLALFLYIVIYIGFFFYLRFRVIGSTINLTETLSKLSSLLTNINNYSFYIQTLVYLIILIIIVLWFLIIIKFRHYLSNKIWQLYFYYGAYLDETTRSTPHWPLFLKCIWYFKKYRLWKLQLKIGLAFQNFIIKITKNKNHWLTASQNIVMLHLLIKLFPTIILLFIFAGEIIINNFSLFYIFYYLPFYIIIMLWIRISDTLETYGFLTAEGQILYKMNYRFPDIVYINLSSFDRVYLYSYLHNQRIFKEMDKFYEFVNVGISPKHPIEALCKFEKFILKEGKTIYINLYRDLMCEENALKKDGEFWIVDEEKKH